MTILPFRAPQGPPARKDSRRQSRGEILAAAERWITSSANFAASATARELRAAAEDYETAALSALSSLHAAARADQLRGAELIGRYALAAALYRAALREQGGG